MQTSLVDSYFTTVWRFGVFCRWSRPPDETSINFSVSEATRKVKWNLAGVLSVRIPAALSFLFMKLQENNRGKKKKTSPVPWLPGWDRLLLNTSITNSPHCESCFLGLLVWQGRSSRVKVRLLDHNGGGRIKLGDLRHWNL